MVRKTKETEESFSVGSGATDELKELKEFANDIEANTVYDNLNSDIKYFYTSGCRNLDIVFGGKGLPSGRFLEIFGYESCGKSTISLCIAKSFVEYWKERNEKCVVLWLEAESVFDKMRAKYIGCDLNHFLIKEVLSIEDAFNTINSFIDRGAEKKIHTMIVLDTIAALHPEKELKDGEFAGGMMLKPRIIKSELSKVIPKLGQTDSPMIFVNQVYGGGGPYEAPVALGGAGPKYYASIRAEISVKQRIKKLLPSGDEMGVAILSKVLTRKNKVTLPLQIAYLYIDGEKGLQPFETALGFCESAKYMTSKGSWRTLKVRQKKDDGTFEETEICYQNPGGFKKKAMEIGLDYMKYLDYLTTMYYANISIFLKVNLIDDIWKYEEELFGRRETTLTDEEREIAQTIYQKEVIENVEVEDQF